MGFSDKIEGIENWDYAKIELSNNMLVVVGVVGSPARRQSSALPNPCRDGARVSVWLGDNAN